MTPAEISASFRARLGDRVLEAKDEGIYPFVRVDPAVWADAAAHAKDALRCETLHDLTAVDSKDRKTLAVDVRLWSYTLRHWVNLRADVDRVDPRIATLVPLWNAADWHERECWDMFGVRFEGHPNLRRILCAEDWVGFPLRKDYEYPAEYHGIPGIPVLRAYEKTTGHCFPPVKAAAPPKPAAAAAAKSAAAAAAAPPAPPPAAGGGA